MYVREENSNHYWCLSRNRSGTRRSIPETRLQRSRKLEKHHQSKSIPGNRECCARRRRHRRPAHASKIVDTAVSRFGRIDVLINNAGVFIPKPFTEYTTEDFDTLVSTTLAGFLYVSQLAVKQMLRQKSGSIVNVSTTLVDQP